MGALLVSLLQCRNSQSLYPNVSATQALHVTYQQPCSVPFIVTRAHGQRASFLAEAAATQDNAKNSAGSREHFDVSPGSSALEMSPELHKHRPLALDVRQIFAEGEGEGATRSRAAIHTEKINSTVNATAAAEEATLEPQEQEQLRLRLTFQPRPSPDFGERKQANNAIYRYTLPGTFSMTSASPPQPSPAAPPITFTPPAAAMSTVKPTAATGHTSPGNRTDTPSCTQLPTPACSSSSSSSPPRDGDNTQGTQLGGSADHLSDVSQRSHEGLVARNSGAAVDDSHHNHKDGGTAPRLTLSPPRPSPSEEAGTDYHHGAGGVSSQDKHKKLHISEGKKPAMEEQENEGWAGVAADDADVELGPMDCADAFQYFYDSEEAYRDVESVIYISPSQAPHATRKDAARDRYLNQPVALRGIACTPLADGEGTATNGLAISQDASSGGHPPYATTSLLITPSARGSAMDTLSLPRAVPPLGPTVEYAVPIRGVVPLEDRAISRSFLDAAAPTSATAAAAAAADTYFNQMEKQSNGAGRFVSLVEEMYLTCRRVGNAPVVCWRSVDRITSLPEAPRSLFGMGGSARNAARSALQNACGEVEDDASHLPGASDATGKAARHRSNDVHRFTSHDNKDDTKDDFADRPHSDTARASSLYYLGPQQYMTASVWWSRVEAFSFGLRTIGLHPGDFVAIVEDTRWEWLVTCYAAWSSGLVVVTLDASDRTMRRVAMDTCGEMRAVVCNPQVHHRLRRHFKNAARQAARYAEEQANEDNCSTSTSVVSSDCRSSNGNSNDDRSTEHCGEPASLGHIAAAAMEDVCYSDCTGRIRHGWTTTSASTNATAHSRPRAAQSREHPQNDAAPLFIVVRSVAPARDGQTKEDRGSSAYRTDAGVSSTSPVGGPTCRARHGSPAGHGRYMGGPQQDEHPCQHTSDDEAFDGSDREEEEALWWSDILSCGEAELAAWRQRRARERRQYQRAQVRLRFQQQQRQRWARNDLTTNTSTNQMHDLTGTATVLRPQHSSTSTPLTMNGAGSREGSAISTCISAPTPGWAAVTTCTTATTTTAMTVCADASPGLTSASTAPTDVVGKFGGGVSNFALQASLTSEGSSAQKSTTTATLALPTHATPLQRVNTTPVPNTNRCGTSPSVSPSSTPLLGAAAAQFGHPGNNNMNSSMELPLFPLRPDDLAFILYTEGEPKGVLLTHGAVKASAAAHAEYFDTTDIGFDDGLRRGGGGPGGGSSAKTVDNIDSKSAKDEGRVESGANGKGRLACSYASARMPALRSRTAPVGRPSYLAYLPLHHISEFMAQTTLLIRGVLVCYGTRRTLFDAFTRPHGDLTEYKPTIFPALPATLARLHCAVQAMISTGYRRLLFDVAYEARRQAIRRGLQTPFVLSTIFAQPRELLGGRCRLVLSREAPLHPRDQEYLEVVCGVSVVQQYGPAETAGCGLQQAYCVGHLDSVGGPLGPTQVKLRDVAGGWTHQSERPTGELLLGGLTIMAGYYCQPELTAEVLEKSGWFHSRMLVERCPDGAFRCVASLRPHHALTSNGQCIDLEQLEVLYGSHPLCTPGGICLLVHPYRRYLCALILSNERRARAFVKAEVDADAADFAGMGEEGDHPLAAPSPRASSLSTPGVPTSPFATLASASAEPGWWPQCLRDPVLHNVAARSLVAWVSKHGGVHHGGVGVAPHERVRHVRVLYDVWDATRRTRTPTGRLFRYGIHCRYSSIIHELFAEPD